LRIKNDLKASVEERRAAAPRVSSTPRVARGRGQQGDKPLTPIQKMFNLIFGMCKSQHATDVKAQHGKHARKKDTKSAEEIHSHISLQNPHFAIASKGEESLEIESFEERVARFEVENLVQQWYGDTSFNGFGFFYGGEAGPSPSHPSPFDSPPPAHPQNDEENKESEDESEGNE
jgi:hypothetical protein